VSRHAFRVELTVTAALLNERKVMGDNLADVTIAFELPVEDPPRDIPDAEVQGLLAKNMSPVIHLLATALVLQGFEHHGQVDEPLGEHTKGLVGYGLTEPGTVRVDVVPPVAPEQHD
jgi:hypothetical protein